MKYIYLCITFFVISITFAQTKHRYQYKNTPLASILETIEKQHDVIFSFANDIIGEKTVNLIQENITLDELLIFLEEQTGLAFQKISESQIIITQKVQTLNSQVLNEVIISGYVTSGIDRNKDGSIDVSSKSLGILPGLVTPDILQSIQLVPGISTLDESASGIQIRGGTPDQNLILFDDIKLFNSGYLFGMFSSFNPYATERVNLFKSGTSAAYGDRISGIIDISTGESIPENTIAGFGLDGLSLDAYVKTPLSNKLGAYVFARRSYADIYESFAYNKYAKTIFRNTGAPTEDINGNRIDLVTDDDYTDDSSSNKFSFYDINAKVIFKPNEKNKMILSSLITQNTLDFSFDKGGELRIDDQKINNTGISFNWEFTPSSKYSFNAKSYLSSYRSHYTNDEIISDSNILEETNLRKNTIEDIGFSLKSHHTFNKKHNLMYGYEVSNTEVRFLLEKREVFEPESNEDDALNQKNLKNALFAQYQYRNKKGGFLGIGLRGVHYGSVEKGFLEPRLTFEHPIVKGLRFKVAMEKRNQPISQLVEFNQTELRLENNIWRLSDERFPLLQSNQISGGLLFKKNGWTLDTDLYYKELKGLTSFTAGFSTPLLNLNLGASKIKGIDVLVKKKIGNYRIWLGYTFNKIDFSFPDIQEGNFSGNNDITHSLRISNTLKVKDWQFSMGWQYRTGKPVTPISSFNSNGNIVDFGSINSKRLEDFHRLDASVIYNFKFINPKGWNGQLGLSALNLYDRKKPIAVTYRAEDEGQGLELEQVIQRFSLGFTPNISFRVFF